MPLDVDIESDGERRKLYLSMRAKVALGGLCFFMVVGMLFSTEIPNLVQALRGLEENPPDLKPSYLYEVYLCEDFDDSLNSLFSHWFSDTNDIGFISVSKNSLFLNLSYEEYSPWYKGICALSTRDYELLQFMGFEVRLRCSSDNKLESDVGGGLRSWGYQNGVGSGLRDMGDYGQGLSRLSFESASVDSDWGTAGFRTLSLDNDKILFTQRIHGVDIREWHTYTILWRPGNATFLVDGLIVASTTEVPDEAMHAFIRNHVSARIDADFDTQFITFPSHQIGSEQFYTDEFIQVDYVKIFYEEEQFKAVESELSRKFSHARRLITLLDQKGENTTQLDLDLMELQDGWEKNRYFYEQDNRRLESMIECMENWEEILVMVFQADRVIKELEQEDNDEINMTRGQYDIARLAWAKYDYNTTRTYLRKILIEGNIEE